MSERPIILDGSEGEGGGQILRTALTLSLLLGRPFRIEKIRANREKPGLRPQHLAAVKAAAQLGRAKVDGAAVGSRALDFQPGQIDLRDRMEIDIGTAGATGLVLQTLHLPLALKGQGGTLILDGGTFNLKAPSFPFLEATWARHLGLIGLPISASMPAAGFYPRGGGRIEVAISPGTPRPIALEERGWLGKVVVQAGVCRLDPSIAERMIGRVEGELAGRNVPIEVRREEWPGPAPGTAIALTAAYERVSATFVGLGERGKPAELVAGEALAELAAYLDSAGAVDPHSADQILLPLAFAEGTSSYTVSEVTDHLRTNVRTIGAFVGRRLTIDEGTGLVEID